MDRTGKRGFRFFPVIIRIAPQALDGLDPSFHGALRIENHAAGAHGFGQTSAVRRDNRNPVYVSLGHNAAPCFLANAPDTSGVAALCA